MTGITDFESDCSEYEEVDPTGRYGRYNEVLGRGATKTVYRAFDEYQGIEVAWNQVKLNDFLQSPDDLERLYCEIHLLKTLKHDNIMKFYASWVDTSKRHINFVTEMFTSGTLRQYRLKHKRVNIRAVKYWCRQILKGLLYLHSHDPPVIHRDLKCDNIFINGNQGEVKIGDLGLAAILRKSHAAHCVGTPEFMAPEVYKEEYNELVDIYSFGMCVLEMVTFEYPYSECTNPLHIYKKVVSGKKPDALYRVKDPEVRQFIEKCLATVSSRHSARELLSDPFLQIDDSDSDLTSTDCRRSVSPGPPGIDDCSYLTWHCNNNEYERYSDEWQNYPVETNSTGIELFEHHDEDEHFPDVDITIKGKRREDGSIFLRLRIADKDGVLKAGLDHIFVGRIRNIYFPFNIDTDTALSVATEMVAELDITDQDVTCIADMIDGEISSLEPEWKSGLRINEESLPDAEHTTLLQNLNSDSDHTSVDSFMGPLSIDENNHHFIQLSDTTHGRFEEITYQLDEADKEDEPLSAELQGNEGSWDRQESVELSSHDSAISHSDEERGSGEEEKDGKRKGEGSRKSGFGSGSVQRPRAGVFRWEARWRSFKWH